MQDDLHVLPDMLKAMFSHILYVCHICCKYFSRLRSMCKVLEAHLFEAQFNELLAAGLADTAPEWRK